jgi:hypothetical protein
LPGVQAALPRRQARRTAMGPLLFGSRSTTTRPPSGGCTGARTKWARRTASRWTSRRSGIRPSARWEMGG